jgi:hypothetical protein
MAPTPKFEPERISRAKESSNRLFIDANGSQRRKWMDGNNPHFSMRVSGSKGFGQVTENP